MLEEKDSKSLDRILVNQNFRHNNYDCQIIDREINYVKNNLKTKRLSFLLNLDLLIPIFF